MQYLQLSSWSVISQGCQSGLIGQCGQGGQVGQGDPSCPGGQGGQSYLGRQDGPGFSGGPLKHIKKRPLRLKTKYYVCDTSTTHFGP